MISFLAIVAGIVTFLLTQFIGALLIALLGSTHPATSSERRTLGMPVVVPLDRPRMVKHASNDHTLNRC